MTLAMLLALIINVLPMTPVEVYEPVCEPLQIQATMFRIYPLDDESGDN